MDSKKNDLGLPADTKNLVVRAANPLTERLLARLAIINSHSRQQERRLHQRFHLQDGAYVLHETILGQIIDVSLEGIAFSYVSESGLQVESTKLDLIFGGENYLTDINFTSITDLIIEDRFSTPLISMRRCGIKFSRLTIDQENKMKNLIRSHADM